LVTGSLLRILRSKSQHDPANRLASFTEVKESCGGKDCEFAPHITYNDWLPRQLREVTSEAGRARVSGFSDLHRTRIACLCRGLDGPRSQRADARTRGGHVNRGLIVISTPMKGGLPTDALLRICGLRETR